VEYTQYFLHTKSTYRWGVSAPKLPATYEVIYRHAWKKQRELGKIKISNR